MAKESQTELIQRFKEFVYSHDLRLEQAAILLKMSPSGIYRMFNRESGTLHPSNRI